MHKQDGSSVMSTPAYFVHASACLFAQYFVLKAVILGNWTYPDIKLHEIFITHSIPTSSLIGVNKMLADCDSLSWGQTGSCSASETFI